MEVNNNNNCNGYNKYDKELPSCEIEYLQEATCNNQMPNKEFIRRLVNDYIHFKIYGKSKYNCIDPNDNKKYEELKKSTDDTITRLENGETKRFNKTAKTLRKVSVELERMNSDFFDKVCSDLQIEKNPEKTFQVVSEEVLSVDSLNWGRVVSLFTFGGKLAQWFWTTQQKTEMVEEVEEWLTESLSGKEEWIEKNGGWDNFNETFENDEIRFPWLKSGLLVCLGVSMAALFTFRK